MTQSYQERTAINAWRATFAILGTLLAVTTMRPLAGALGGGPAGFAWAGTIFVVWMILPWIPVYRVTFERPELRRPTETSFREGLRSISRHESYRILVALYLLGRIAIDLATVMFLYYFTYWLRRPGDFEITMGLFLVSVVCAFPLWVRVSRRRDKRAIFLMGAASWIASQVFLFMATPDWPRAAVFAGAAIAGAGYAAADMIPWSMLGEVVDEDELRSGERREGLYFGFFTFLRKLGGAGSVAIALWVLELSGYVANGEQSPATLTTIRVLTACVPGVFVLLAALVALRYPLSRERHAAIAAALERRRGAALAPVPGQAVDPG
jgi:Na+/melibiose symporter-like transporter